MVSAEEATFGEYLASRNLKFTQERRQILREVFRIHKHFEAEDIVIGMISQGIRVSRASVYRTLPVLVESGLLREVHSSEKHSHYEHVFGHEHHDHLICTKCGAEIEFSDQMIEELQDRVCREHGFVPSSHKLEITGTCRRCAESAG